MTRNLMFGLFVVLMGLGMVGNMDYADALHTEAIKKEQRPRLAQPSPAPIYSKRCAARGLDFVAHQADGGRWIVHCVPQVRA